MFLEQGFWLMVAGFLLVAVGFIGLAFSRLGNEMPFQNEEAKGEELTPTPVDLPNPLSTYRTEVAKPFGRAGPQRTEPRGNSKNNSS
jgi:hypothetical protein